jgi:hypothetical protein
LSPSSRRPAVAHPTAPPGVRTAFTPQNIAPKTSKNPYWKRAHRDWRIWFCVVLMLAAMFIYVMSDDLAWRPRVQPTHPISGAVEK